MPTQGHRRQVAIPRQVVDSRPRSGEIAHPAGAKTAATKRRFLTPGRGDGAQHRPLLRGSVRSMNNNAPPPPNSDAVYKRLYSFRRMVEDLLRSLFDDAELRADYRTLEKLPAEYVGDALQQRRGDTVWRLRAATPPAAGCTCW